MKNVKSDQLKAYWKKRLNLKEHEAVKGCPLRFLEKHTVNETAAILGVTRQRIQQIERLALDKLRWALKETYETYCK